MATSKTKTPLSLKPRKIPPVNGALEGYWDGVGRFAFRSESDELRVKWSVDKKEQKDAAFLELCKEGSKCEERAELGELIAKIAEQQGLRMLHTIPGPNEAMREQNVYLRIAGSWRHWAVVPAGHMVFPEPRKPRQKAKRSSAI